MARISRALISVSDKSGIAVFAAGLAERGVQILSTGGTARLLRDHGVPTTEIADYTGYPELMDGRLKTLHPKIHGGILGRRGQDEATMAAHDLPPIDLVVVNLYPFARTVATPDCDLTTAIESIDIGGPALLRAAAKNHAAVAAVVSPQDYATVLREMDQNGGELRAPTRRRLALRVFEQTARYDASIAAYLARQATENNTAFPDTLTLLLQHRQTMRYGENPHQRAAFYVLDEANTPGVATALQLQGKELSFNNVADADAALDCLEAFAEGPACVIVKHANPCGVAVAETPLLAYERAYATDPTSAFGGIIAFNRPLDGVTAAAIVERQFLEVLLAPGIEAEALTALQKKKNIRVLACEPRSDAVPRGYAYRHVRGGMLVQEEDTGQMAAKELRVVTRRPPREEELRDLLFTWRVCKFVKSNAIVYGRDRMTIGVGAGQMSRIHSARIAALKAADAGLDLAQAVMASDAFFPFRDGVDAAAALGVTAIIQPGGSVRDEEVIRAADEHGMAMVFTGMRHFRH